MPPVPPERFARLFRGLDADERAAFVAALWDERGWETSTDGTVVTATRDAETRRIRVVDPGRFGTPPLGDADELVAARDREAVRAAAERAGVRYLGPEAVRELLLYGLDRSAASALFERTFDRPLERQPESAPPLRERARNAGVALTQTVERRTDTRLVAVLLVVGLLAGAAVGGPALAPGPEQTVVASPAESVTPGDVGAVGVATSTPASTPTAATGSDGRPPGLGERALVDPGALADAHARAVIGESRRLHIEAKGPPKSPLLGGHEALNTTAWIEHSNHYRFEGHYQLPPENGAANRTVTVNVFARGETKFRRLQGANGTTYQRYPLRTTGDARGFAFEVRDFLALLLDGDISTVECAGQLADGDCLAYRVTVTGAPPEFHRRVDNYQAVAVVQDDGIVSSLNVTYGIPVDGEFFRVEFQLTYDGFGTTTVSEPAWLETAKNETSG